MTKLILFPLIRHKLLFLHYVDYIVAEPLVFWKVAGKFVVSVEAETWFYIGGFYESKVAQENFLIIKGFVE